MAKYNKLIPDGSYDMLFKECEAKREVENIMVDIFKRHGFNEVITPSLEFYDVFDGKAGMQPEIMYKLIDNKGRILVLRPDNTIPIARITSTKLRGFMPPLRLYYNQNVFRISPSLSGRRDEIPQCGIELIGTNGIKSDLEVLNIAVAVLQQVTNGNFRFEIGHVGFFKSLVDELPLESEKIERLRGYIESKNYAALNTALEPYAKENRACRSLIGLPKLFGGIEVLDRAKEIATNEEGHSTIEYLREIYHQLCSLGVAKNIMIDLGLINQIEYYTGVIFKGYVQESGDSVLSGGRYDELIAEFGQRMPATGFGVNTNALARAANRIEKSNRSDVLIFYQQDHTKAAYEHMKKLISEGLICEMSVHQTVSDSLEYAQTKGIKRLDIVTDKIITQKVNLGET
jgi:ATP phosphoribosyltransferase regulatory subunit